MLVRPNFLIPVAVGALLLTGCSATVSVGSPDSSSSAAADMLQIDAPALAKDIGAKVGKTVTIDCPTDVPIQKGLATECTVTDGTYTNALTVTQSDDQGNVKWRIGDVISGPSGSAASSEASATPAATAEAEAAAAAPEASAATAASGMLAPVTTQDEFTALFMTDAEVDATLPKESMKADWTDGQQGPTTWATGNKIAPAKCQIFEDFGRLRAGAIEGGPLAWVGAKGWKSEKRNANDFGQTVTETIGVYQDEATATAAFKQMSELAKACQKYKFAERTDITKHRFDSVDVSSDPQVIAWTVKSPDDGKVAWVGSATWIGDRVVYLEEGIQFRDHTDMLKQYPTLLQTALTRAVGGAQ